MKAREPHVLLTGQSKVRRLYRTLAFREQWADEQLKSLTEAVDHKWEPRVVLALAAELVRANNDLPKSRRLQAGRRPE